ncbi:MAG: hypothetical protein HC865_13515 [Cyanobacteria bacterium RU_5_0]|nr:hypothetical protein [Cyanobacteria bacterium RU_5_0]
MIGQLYRDEKFYIREPIEVFDHGWTTLATGVAIPHGLYDITDSVGYIQIGTSHDTSEFACDSLLVEQLWQDPLFLGNLDFTVIRRWR